MKTTANQVASLCEWTFWTTFITLRSLHLTETGSSTIAESKVLRTRKSGDHIARVCVVALAQHCLGSVRVLSRLAVRTSDHRHTGSHESIRTLLAGAGWTSPICRRTFLAKTHHAVKLLHISMSTMSVIRLTNSTSEYEDYRSACSNYQSDTYWTTSSILMFH